MNKFRGVSAHKDSGFVANIGLNGGKVYLGWFRSFDDAKAARLDAEVRLFGSTFDRRDIVIDESTAKIPLHGQRGVFKGWALVNVDDLQRVQDIAWTLDPRGYVVGRPAGSKTSVTMHRWLAPDFAVVDHRNRDRQDNRRENLRECTQAENTRNTALSVNNTSGAKGVTPTASGAWRARIWVDRTEIHIGTYPTREAARQAYDAKATELHGAFASPNVEITPVDAPCNDDACNVKL